MKDNLHFLIARILRLLYRVAAWTGYYHIFPITESFILSKFMNFWMAEMYGNNGMFYGDTKI